jgi:hypothetical protein
MVHFKPIFASCLVSTASLSLAGPLERGWVPPEAKWVVHVDLDAVRGSTLFAFVSAHRKDLELDGLDEFKEKTGIDPLEDLKGVTVFGSKSAPQECVAIVTATRAVDGAIAKLVDEQHALERTSEGELTLYTWKEGGAERYGFVRPGLKSDERIVLASADKPRLLEAIRRLDRTGPPAPPEEGGVIAAPPHAGSMLFVSATSVGGLTPAHSVMLDKMEGVRIDIGETTEHMYGEVTVTMRSTEDASNTLQMLQGAIAFGRMAAQNEPELKDLIKACDLLKLKTDAKAITASMSCTSRELRDLMDAALAASEREDKAAKGRKRPGTPDDAEPQPDEAKPRKQREDKPKERKPSQPA